MFTLNFAWSTWKSPVRDALSFVLDTLCFLSFSFSSDVQRIYIQYLHLIEVVFGNMFLVKNTFPALLPPDSRSGLLL